LTSENNLSASSLAELIGELALSKKAEHVLMIDVSDISSITDFFVFASADTDVQGRAIADGIRRGTPHKPWRSEGEGQLNWIILDYVDVVVHVMRTEERNYYNLEKLWADAPARELTDEPEAISGKTIS